MKFRAGCSIDVVYRPCLHQRPHVRLQRAPELEALVLHLLKLVSSKHHPCPSRHQTCVKWHPMTWRAISSRPDACHVIDTHFKSRFLKFNGIRCHGEQYLAGPTSSSDRARRLSACARARLASSAPLLAFRMLVCIEVVSNTPGPK